MRCTTHLVENLELRTLLSGGDLDPSFGDSGIATKSFGGTISEDQVIIQSDEKPIISMIVTTGSPAKPELVLARFDTHGAIDKTFGQSGMTIVPMDSTDERISEAVLDGQGRVLIWLGKKLLRFNTAGQIEAHLPAAPMPIQSRTYGAFLTNGDLVEPYNTGLHWLHPDGTLDKSYGNHGVLESPFTLGGSDGKPRSLVLGAVVAESDGSILALINGGDPDYDITSAVVHVTVHGKVDYTFGDDGTALTGAMVSNFATGMKLTSSGSILAMSSSDEGDTYISEFDASGQEVRNFGAFGYVRGDVFNFQDDGLFFDDIFPTPNGKIVVTGGDDPGSTFKIGRLGGSGKPDASFSPGDPGNLGETAPNFPTTDDLAVGADQSIVLATVDGNKLTLGKLKGLTEPLINAKGTLQVDGTDGDDTIDISTSHGQIIATVNGKATSYSAGKVKRIFASGHGGNDQIENHTSLSTSLYGNSGDDYLQGGPAADLLLPGDGSNSISGDGGQDTIAYDDRGTTDFSVGTDFEDVALVINRQENGQGISETDTVNNPTFNQYIIRGTPGDDSFSPYTASGQAVENAVWDVTLYGGAGDDSFGNTVTNNIRNVNDVWEGGSGNDTFDVGDVGPAPGKIIGGPGNDWVLDEQFLSESPDAIDLGSGNDTVDVSQDVDFPITLYAGPGVEELTGPDTDDFPTKLIGNAWDNTLISSSTGGVTISGGDGNDHLIDSERGNSKSPDKLIGDAGDDTLDASGGSVAILNGGDDNDSLIPNDFNDSLEGGDGNDVADFSSFSANLRITLDNNPNDAIGGDIKSMNVGNDIEQILGGSGDDFLVGSFRPDLLNGGHGNDTLWGGAGRNTLLGGAGDDEIHARGGNDIINGGGGNDKATVDPADQVSSVELIV